MKLKNQKILKITESYFPNDVRVFKEAMAYTEAGASVSVIAMNDGNQKPVENISNITVYRLPISMKKGNWFGYIYEYILFFLYSFFYVFKLSLKTKFDIVHVHTIPDYLVFASLPAKLRGAKVILDLAELMPEFYKFKFKVGTKNIIVRISKFFEYISMHYATHCITINHRIKDILVNRTGIEDLTIIMNTIEPSKLKLYDREPDKTKFTMIYHGHINAAYDFRACLEAVNLIKNDIPNFLFNIYGDGPFLPEIEIMVRELNIEKHVKFYGWVDRETVYKAIVDSDIGIIPAKIEEYLNLSFSNKLGDFVALGVPIISPKLESYIDYFPLDSLAYIEEMNAKYLYDMVVQLNNDRARLNQLVEISTKHYSKINWTVMKERLISLAAR